MYDYLSYLTTSTFSFQRNDTSSYVISAILTCFSRQKYEMAGKSARHRCRPSPSSTRRRRHRPPLHFLLLIIRSYPCREACCDPSTQGIILFVAAADIVGAYLKSLIHHEGHRQCDRPPFCRSQLCSSITSVVAQFLCPGIQFQQATLTHWQGRAFPTGGSKCQARWQS